MKRSKIFLGLTTCVLAVVAFASAKSAKFFGNKVKAYYSVNSGPCTRFAATSFFTKSEGTDRAKVNGIYVFSYNATACSHPLYTKSN